MPNLKTHAYSLGKEGVVPRPPKEVVISKKEIGERVRALRLAREMTQAQLAEILGTRHTNVSGVERGMRGLTIQQLVKLARALEVSPAEILDGEQPKSRRTANGHLPRRFERIRALPRPKQRVLHEIIDAFLDKQDRS
jgi:transcriptional regulator with XRE-family HTH domain